MKVLHLLFLALPFTLTITAQDDKFYLKGRNDMRILLDPMEGCARDEQGCIKCFTAADTTAECSKNPDLDLEPCCEGTKACVWDDKATTICPGSCNGDKACMDFQGQSVGEKSCNGGKACKDFQGLSVGENSCGGYRACKSFSGSGGVGSKSCNGSDTCNQAKGSVGDESCNDFCKSDDDDECMKRDNGKACYRFEGSGGVGSNSCNARWACYKFSHCWNTNHPCTEAIGSAVGNDSCNERRACKSVRPGGFIGNGSCNGLTHNACELVHTVGDCVESCDEFKSCDGTCPK